MTIGANSLAVAPTAASVVESLDREDWPKWDDFVSSSALGDIVQSSAWALAKERLGFWVDIVALRQGKDGAILAGAVLLSRRVGGIFRIGYVAHGPILAPQATVAEIEQIFDGIEEAAWRRGLACLIVQPGSTDPFMQRVLEERGYLHGSPNVCTSASLRLDLSLSEEQLRAGMSSNRRRNIKKAESSFEFWRSDDDSLGLFSKLHSASARRQGYEPRSDAFLAAHCEVLRPRGMVEVFFVNLDGAPLAAIWMTRYANVLTLKLVGWNPEIETKVSPNDVLYWKAILWAKSAGIAYFDFGGFSRAASIEMSQGRSLEGVPLNSLDEFKRRFGATAVVYSESVYKVRPAVVHWAIHRLRQYPMFRSFVQKSVNRFRG